MLKATWCSCTASSLYEDSGPNVAGLPIRGKTHAGEGDRRMISQEFPDLLRPMIPRCDLPQRNLHYDKLRVYAIIRRQMGSVGLCDHRLDSEFSVPQPPVMRADIADVTQTVQPRRQDRVRQA